jgi:hypothetical protein
MSVPYIVIIALAAGLAAFFSVRALRAGAKGASPAPEALLLEEAVVTEPIAPGMEGKAELRKRGAKPLNLRARAMDSAQAFARGAKVRVIDYREGCCLIESADEEHLVR